MNKDKREKAFKARTNINSPQLMTRKSAKNSQRSFSIDNLTDYGPDNNITAKQIELGTVSFNKQGINAKPEVKIIVGEGTDADVKTIAEAVEIAQPGTVIKIDEGKYRESIKITRNNIRIEPRTKDGAVYLLGEEGPSITIDLKMHENCIIKGLIIAHFGSNIANKFNEQLKDNDLENATPNFLKKFDINKDMDCAILVLGGNAIVRNSLISLKSLPDNIKSTIPAFVAMPGTRVNMVSTEFRGNELIMTGGFISLNAEILVSDCKFHNFKAGGIFISGNNGTSIKLSDTEISSCGIVGLYSQGEDWKPLFLRLKVNNIEGPAIKIYKANRAKIKGCEVTKCQTGIEVICGDPFIVLNKIFQNYENGILTVAKGDFRCDALIKFNEIIKNKDNGLLCCGKGMKSLYNIYRKLY